MIYVTDFFNLRLIDNKTISVSLIQLQELLDKYKSMNPVDVSFIIRRADIRKSVKYIFNIEYFKEPTYIVHLDKGDVIYPLIPMKHLKLGQYISAANFVQLVQVFQVIVN